MSNFFKPQIISIYRDLLRESNKIHNYNFRSHMKRYVINNFSQIKTNNSQTFSTTEKNEKIQKFLEESKKELEKIRRISLINNLYPSEIPSVIEVSKGK